MDDEVFVDAVWIHTNVRTSFGGVAMRVSHRGNRFVVIDDFLTTDSFAAVVRLAKESRYRPIVQSDTVARLDGPAYKSGGVSFPAHVGNAPVSGRPEFYTETAKAMSQEPELFGEAGSDWSEVSFTFWKYPAGSRLGWHNDSLQGRRGAFVLFAHDYWNAAWGGELMIMDHPSDVIDQAKDGVWTFTNNDPAVQLGEALVACELNPVAVLPKPNRLVLFTVNTFHTVRRVDEIAGENMRMTVTGFANSRESFGDEAASKQSSASIVRAAMLGRPNA